MDVGTIIKSARIKTGLSQLQVSRALGFKSSMFISLVERGESKLPHTHIKTISKILRIDKKTLIEAIIKEIAVELERDAK